MATSDVTDGDGVRRAVMSAHHGGHGEYGEEKYERHDVSRARVLGGDESGKRIVRQRELASFVHL